MITKLKNLIHLWHKTCPEDRLQVLLSTCNQTCDHCVRGPLNCFKLVPGKYCGSLWQAVQYCKQEEYSDCYRELQKELEARLELFRNRNGKRPLADGQI